MHLKIDNPAFDYEKSGQQYSTIRQADPRIAQFIAEALKGAKTLLNVGAGAGSYEPSDKYVIAVEPSAEMRSQRLKNGKVPAIDAKAGYLPFDDDSFDASMALVTLHHWPDRIAGLKEMRRVTKNQILVMTFDPHSLDNFWNAKYFPELIEVEKIRYPEISFITEVLGGECDVIPIPIPLDCTDGFQEAFYGRPEAFLKEEVRKSQSAWGFLSDEVTERLVNNLEMDLISGAWDRQYGHFRTQPFFTCALRLIVSKP